MKNIVIRPFSAFVVATLIMFFVVPTQAEITPEALRVVAANIGVQTWNNVRDELYRIIGGEVDNDVPADLVGVTEASGKARTDLRREFSSTMNVVKFGDQSGAPADQNAIFYSKSRFGNLPVDSGYLELASTENYEYYLTWVYLQDANTGVIYAVYNTHLVYQDLDIRADQASQIHQFIEAQDHSYPIVFMGDLNTSYNLQAYTDAYSYLVNPSPDGLDLMDTWKVRRDGTKNDVIHILTSDVFSDLASYQFKFENGYFSDHQVLIADIEMNEN